MKLTKIIGTSSIRGEVRNMKEGNKRTKEGGFVQERKAEVIVHEMR